MEIEPASILQSLILISSLWSVLGPLFIIVLLLVCSGLVSGSEIAFFSLSPQDIDGLAKEASTKSKRILKLRENPPKLLATILISNNLINIGIILISDLLIKSILPEENFVALGEKWTNFVPLDPILIGKVVSFLITVVVVSFFLLLFGEILPKIYASINNLGFVKFMERPMNVLSKIFSPFSNRLVKSTSIFETRFAANQASMDQSTKDDIEDAIDFSVSQEIYKDDQAGILKGIIKFGDVSAKQIMKSRMDIFAIDLETDFHSMFKQVVESGFSRIPVYEEDLDKIKGILYVKDLLGLNDEKKEYKWQGVVRDSVLYVPETKKIDDLLKEFQQKRLHLAIVVDEFGGTSGLVTLEDIMEEVIGEITDEFDDQEELDYVKLDDKNFIFEGKVLLNDVCRVIGEDIDFFDDVKKASDSLAGLILEMHGQIPRKGLSLELGRYSFKIREVSSRRIEKIKLHINDTLEEDGEKKLS